MDTRVHGFRKRTTTAVFYSVEPTTERIGEKGTIMYNTVHVHMNKSTAVKWEAKGSKSIPLDCWTICYDRYSWEMLMLTLSSTFSHTEWATKWKILLYIFFDFGTTNFFFRQQPKLKHSELPFSLLIEKRLHYTQSYDKQKKKWNERKHWDRRSEKKVNENEKWNKQKTNCWR